MSDQTARTSDQVAATPRRTGLLLVLGLLAVVGGLMLLFGGDAQEAPKADGGNTQGSLQVDDAELLRGEGSPESTATLAGRASEEAASTLRHGPVRARVLGLGGRPLAGVLVYTRSASGDSRDEQRAFDKLPPVSTDESGVAHFAELPYDGSVRVLVLLPEEVSFFGRLGGVVRDRGGAVITPDIRVTAQPMASASVRGERVVLQANAGLPLDLKFVGPRGERLPVRAKVSPLLVAPRDPEAMPVVYVTGWSHTTLKIEPEALRDFDGPKPLGLKVIASPRADRLSARIPVRPTCLVRLVPPAGVDLGARPTFPARIRVGANTHTVTAASDAYGRVVIGGVPYIPGAVVATTVDLGPHGRLTGVGQFNFDEPDLLLGATHHPAVGTAKTLALLQEKLRDGHKGLRRLLEGAAVAPDGSTDPWFSDTFTPASVDLTEFMAEEIEIDVEEGEGLGSLRLRVLTAEGLPAIGAKVELETGDRVLVDQAGIAYFEHVQPGACVARVFGAGSTFTYAAAVRSGKTTEVTARASHGGRIDLRVVDDQGHPLPCAEVGLEQASKLPYADVADGVQCLDEHTDDRGLRMFDCVEGGNVHVTASYAGKRATATVEVREGQTSVLELIVPLWAPPEAPISPPPAANAEREQRIRGEIKMLEMMLRKLGGAERLQEASGRSDESIEPADK